MMNKYHQFYPNYCFINHKGYYTKLHADSLKKYGVSLIHRKTYQPVKDILNHNKS